MTAPNGKNLSAADDLLHQADAELAQAERLLKIAQVARMANVSERTVWRDIQAGRLVVRYPFPHRPRIAISHALIYAAITQP